jgi:hypothetical protein
MQLSHDGVHERLLAAEFEYAVKVGGAMRCAYPTMAGGGADACTIHYGRNDKQVRACVRACACVCVRLRSSCEQGMHGGFAACQGGDGTVVAS